MRQKQLPWLLAQSFLLMFLLASCGEPSATGPTCTPLTSDGNEVVVNAATGADLCALLDDGIEVHVSVPPQDEQQLDSLAVRLRTESYEGHTPPSGSSFVGSSLLVIESEPTTALDVTIKLPEEELRGPGEAVHLLLHQHEDRVDLLSRTPADADTIRAQVGHFSVGKIWILRLVLNTPGNAACALVDSIEGSLDTPLTVDSVSGYSLTITNSVPISCEYRIVGDVLYSLNHPGGYAGVTGGTPAHLTLGVTAGPGVPGQHGMYDLLIQAATAKLDEQWPITVETRRFVVDRPSVSDATTRLQTHRPVIHLSAGEEYQPENVVSHLENGTLYASGDSRTLGTDVAGALNIYGNAESRVEYFPAYEATTPMVYGTAVECENGLLALSYWVFYRQDTKGNGGGHPGDWEMVAALVAPASDSLVAVIYSQHFYYDVVSGEDIPLEAGSRPSVYVALGSHASYPSASLDSSSPFALVAGDRYEPSGATTLNDYTLSVLPRLTEIDSSSNEAWLLYPGEVGGRGGPRMPPFNTAYSILGVDRWIDPCSMVTLTCPSPDAGMSECANDFRFITGYCSYCPTGSTCIPQPDAVTSTPSDPDDDMECM